MRLEYGSGHPVTKGGTKFAYTNDIMWNESDSYKTRIPNMYVDCGVYEWCGGLLWVGVRERGRQRYYGGNARGVWICNIKCPESEAKDRAQAVLDIMTIKHNWRWEE